MQLSQQEKQKIMSERRNLHEYLENEAERAFRGKCVAQRRLCEGEVEMDRRSWERRNSDIALNETNQKLVSQRLELYQANQWPDHAQRENIRLFVELNTKNQVFPGKPNKGLPSHGGIT